MKKKEYRTPHCMSILLDSRERLLNGSDPNVVTVDTSVEVSEGEEAGTRQQSLWTNWES